MQFCRLCWIWFVLWDYKFIASLTQASALGTSLLQFTAPHCFPVKLKLKTSHQLLAYKFHADVAVDLGQFLHIKLS